MLTQALKNASQSELFPRPFAKYAYRLETRKVREPDFPYPKKSITCTTEVIDFVKSLNESDIEKMIVLYLNAQNELIGIHIIPGTVNQAAVFPREVLKHALLSSACSMILVHNHPSGHLRPSEADIRLTKMIRDAAKVLDIQTHDHLIVADGGAFSFREEGLMDTTLGISGERWKP